MAARLLDKWKSSLWGNAARQLARNKLAMLCLVIIVVYAGAAILVALGALAANYNVEVGKSYESPSWRHPLGTDILGRDVVARVIYGAKVAMTVGSIVSLIAIPIGLIIGVVAGYFGGKLDELIVWFYSTVASVPDLLLILSLAYLFGRGLNSVCAAIGLTAWVGLCRLIRGEAIKLREIEYVQAARALGAGHFRIIFGHIVPNVFHLVVIILTLSFSMSIKTEVILSFIGVGVQLKPSWGNMINSAPQELLQGIWWQFAGATAAMFVIVLALNIFGDALRDALDPRLKL